MHDSPPTNSCPVYAPATQITPDSIDEIPTQEIEFYTQENCNESNINNTPRRREVCSGVRNYYEQLFSSDSEDDEDSINSDLSTNITNGIEPHSISSHTPRELFVEIASSSDMSISDSESSEGSFMSVDVNVSDTNSLSSNDSCSTQSSATSSSTNSTLSSSTIEEWKDGNETWGITSLLNNDAIDDLLGVNEIERPPINLEVQEDKEIDKIGSFNIRNKYDHDLAAFFMMKENLTFLSLQEPYSSVAQTSSKSWTSYKKSELESARITCYETPFQIILFDSWKWGGKIISPFQSLHHGRITSIAFGFDDNQKIGIISIYASTKECATSSKEDERPMISDFTTDVEKKIKELYHKFPGICVIVMGDFQETITPSDKDNIGPFRKDHNPDGTLASLLSSHVSLVREKTKEERYITRYGDIGGRGIDHILFPKRYNNASWINSAKIDRHNGSAYFPSDHSYIHCSINRKGRNNNQDSQETRKFNYKKICNIRLKQHSNEHGTSKLKLDESQFKECDNFKDQKTLYNKVQDMTSDSNHITRYYLDEIEERINYLYKELWKEGLKQKVDGEKNKLVKIKEEHAAELSFILRKFQTGIKDTMTQLECYSDVNLNKSAGSRRDRLRKEKGFHFSKSWPIPTKLRYLKIAAKVKLHLLKQVLYFCKEYKIKNRSIEESDFSNIDRSWNKILTGERLAKEVEVCHSRITEDLYVKDNHMQAIQFEKMNKNQMHPPNREKSKDSHQGHNMLHHTPENVTKLINAWLENSNCSQPFNNKTDDTSHYSFLATSPLNYLVPLKNLDMKTMVGGDLDDARKFYSKVQESINILTNFSKKLSRTQLWFKHSNLIYLLHTNKIAQFTSKLMHKDRSAPETHSEIWDPTRQEMRQCKNEYEELIATGEHHNHWMANSKAKEVCAFAKLKIDGKLGTRGITLSPKRIITYKDIPNLVHNGSKMSKNMKEQFIAAHGSHTASLFEPPENDRPELFYPFYLINKTGVMNEDDNFNTNFMKSISSVPSKARYNGFHMAVIGRFGERWQKALYNICKLILILRYIPVDLKRMARFPIPKPGKHNEYRPISLCHDIYCFINGICTKYTSAGIEKANFLHDGIVAYRPGKGCNSLVTIEQSFREDVREHDGPAAQIDEDEEKFFDRIPVEILLAAMRINGFPEQGFLELKASAMGTKFVDIITKKGIAYAKFVCGLEQGNPDSPTVANLVIKLKHDVWNYISTKVKSIFEKNDNSDDGKYTFQSIDEQDGPVMICKIGYCDDNSKYCFIKNENDLKFLIKYYLQLAGDLSMVTKIGRKGSKSEIQFFNVSAEFALKINKIFSSAWSFVHDAPITEEVPIKICLKQSEIKKFMNISNYENLDQIEQQRWDTMLFPKAHRHLGLTGTLTGITKDTRSKTLSKMKERIKSLKIHHMRDEAQVKSFNMLCSTIHSFVPLQTGYGLKELEDVDREVIKTLKKSRGLSSSDAKHSMFLPEYMGGMGFRSIQDTDVISIARELEIICNADSIDSEVFRTRLAAIFKYKDEESDFCYNHALSAIKKLARFGIFLRDQSEHIINRTLAKTEKLPRYQGIGSGRFVNGNKPFLGVGRTKNLDLMYGGTIHKILKIMEEVKWNKKEFSKIYKGKSPVDIRMLKRFRKIAGEEAFEELTSFYSCWEWINPDKLENISKDKADWNYIDISSMLKEKYPDSYWLLAPETIRTEAESILQLKVMPEIEENEKSFPLHARHKKIWEKISKAKSPLFVATDGSHLQGSFSDNEKQQERPTAASFVLCQADIRENEEIQDETEPPAWLDRPSIPLLCRIASLPKSIGTTTSDIAHGEAYAITMQEWALPHFVPRIIVTDSESIRNLYLDIRNLDNSSINRHLIRTLLGGISKNISSNIFRILHGVNSKVKESNIRNERFAKDTISTFQKRNEKFFPLAETWTETEPTLEPNCNKYGRWRKDYFDKHEQRAVLKINSHQLNEAGTKIKSNPRYPKLIPNVSLLNMNHHADVSVELANSFFNQQNSIVRTSLSSPSSILRFYFSWEGCIVDRHISNFVQEKIYKERLLRLQTKPTQGLLWRFFPHVTTNWKTINLHKGWLRALRGLSRTHTRSLYKAENYRLGCLMDSDDKFNYSSDQHQKITAFTKNQVITKLSPCMWCPNHQKEPCPHGNRRHAMVYCKHPDLLEFRTKMTNLIEQKLKNFFVTFEHYTSKDNLEKVFMQIEKECLLLRKSKIGKIKSASTTAKFNYASIQDLMGKYDLQRSQEGCNTKGNFCSELLGILEQPNACGVQDKDLCMLDAFWLGLIPVKLNNIIRSSINRKQISSFTHIKNAYTAMETELEGRWLEINDLLMAKAIGLHRIIGFISKAKEKEYREKFQLGKGTYKALRKEKKRKATDTDVNDNRKEQKVDQHNKKTNQFIPHTESSKVLCSGITCNKKNRQWCLDQNFIPNRIEKKKKHCIRCSKFCTAMKQSAETLHKIGNTTTNKNMSALQHTLHESAFNGIQYTSMMNSLKNCQNIEASTEAISINKKKIPDRQKLICRIITQVHKTTPSSASATTFQSTILQNAKTIQDGLVTSQTLAAAKPQKLYLTDTDSSANKEIINIDSSQSQSTTNDNVNSPPATEYVNKKRRLVAEILAHGQFISDDAITMAIEVMRTKAEKNNIFIAHGLANINITNWNLTQGWERFSRIFNSRIATFTRPNGVYIIPMFIPGHWYTIIIHKHSRNFFQGHIIDSLGKRQIASTMHERIGEAFTQNKGRIEWHNPQSLAQMECECGPRTIISIWKICQGIENKVSMGEYISKATWTNATEGTYDSEAVRVAAAELINGHLPTMLSKSVTFRKRGTRMVAGKTEMGRKRKHKRRSQRKEDLQACQL